MENYISKELISAYESQVELDATVVCVLPNMLLARIGEYSCLMPKSEVELFRINDFSQYVGKQLKVKIRDIQPNLTGAYDVYVSHKAQQQDSLAVENKYVDYETIVRGKSYKAIVTGIESYGVFVSLGVTSGLIHMKSLSDDFAENPNAYLSLGEWIEVSLLSKNEERQQLSFRLKTNAKGERISRLTPFDRFADSLVPEQTIVTGKVKYIEKNCITLYVSFENGNIPIYVKKEDLSWEVINSAADAVFLGEELSVRYIGYENDHLYFDYKWQFENIYPEDIFTEDTDTLISSRLGLQENLFVGKVIKLYKKDGEQNDTNTVIGALAVNLTPYGDLNPPALFVDPFTGTNIVARIEKKYVYGIKEEAYYKFSLVAAKSELRKSSRRPFMFEAKLVDAEECFDPYHEQVEKSFKENKTPKSNRESAGYLKEIGADMYSDRDRMIYELLQNADDSSSKRGVKVLMQVVDNYLIFTHDGLSFSRQDFRAIVSTANSTKRLDKQKTGYKGIGFKSVFTDASKVYIRTGGFFFVFDKNAEIFSNFRSFYRYVNPLYTDEQFEVFLSENSDYEKEFEGVEHLPWQLLPFWQDQMPDVLVNTAFSKQANVAIALDLGVTSEKYKEMIHGIIEKPRFMLFLRNMRRIQYEEKKWDILSIAKIVDKNSDIVHLKSSMEEIDRDISYIAKQGDNVEVSNDSFIQSGIPLRKESKKIGSREKWFLYQTIEGIEVPVTSIPERVIAADTTTISYAIMLDANGDVLPIIDNTPSLYAFLPMEDRHYLFPFYINADFELTPNRQEAKPASAWNEFIFHNIGSGIVRWVGSVASVEHPNYLRLLPSNYFTEDLEEGKTDRLATRFNNAYKEALITEPFILNEDGILSKQEEIIVDDSGLSQIIGVDLFRTLLGTTKKFASSQIDDSSLLDNPDIFNHVEIIKAKNVINLLADSKLVNDWILSADETKYNDFLSWLAQHATKSLDVINTLPLFTFGKEHLSISQLSKEDKSDYILCTDNVSSIRDILVKLGFICSLESITSHPLSDILESIDEESIFEKIKTKLEGNSLLPQEKRTLMLGLKKFANVGEAKVRALSLLKNKTGVPTPANLLCNSDKKYFSNFAISEDEFDSSIESLLIKKEDIGSTLFKEIYIKQIFTKDNISSVYADYGTSWQTDFWLSLVNVLPTDITLAIISDAGDPIKKKFLEKVDEIRLENRTYRSDEPIYGYYSVAQSCNQVGILLTKTYIDGELVSQYNIKDDVIFTIDRIPYTLQLSEILPARKTSIMQQFKSCLPFVNVELTELDKTTILSEIQTDTKTKDLTPAQFVFVCLLNKLNNRSSYYPFNDEKVKSINAHVVECVDYCFNHGVNIDLYQFRYDKGVHFGIQYKFFNHSNDLLLPKELLSEALQSWASSDEKKAFLYDLGARKSDHSLIKLRSAWLDGLDSAEKASEETFEWIASKSHTYLDENDPKRDERIKLLKKLLSGQVYERRSRTLCESVAYSWSDNGEYAKWSVQSGVTIKVCRKGIPVEIYHGAYTYCTLYEDTYYVDGKTIYISDQKEAKEILKAVSLSNSNMFSMEDWYRLFSVSSDAYQELKDEKNDLLRQLDEMRAIIERLRNGEKLDFGAGDDPSISKEEQIQAQLEAQNALLEMKKGIWTFPYGFGDANDEGMPKCKSTIQATDGEGQPMRLVIKSYKIQNNKFNINPSEMEYLLKNEAHLFVYDGFDIKELNIKDLIRDQVRVQLSFSTTNLDAEDKIQEFSDALHYFNDIQFNFASFNLTEKAQSIRNMYNKRSGGQSNTSDVDL